MSEISQHKGEYDAWVTLLTALGLTNLDVALSTRASEATLTALGLILDAIAGDTSNLDVLLSTIASEATVANILARLDEALPTGDNTIGRTKITDGTIVLGLDSIEPVLPTIEMEHHMVHKGQSFTCDDYDDDVDAGVPKYWHIKTPDTLARMHVKITVVSSLPGLVEFFEDPTTTDDGVALAVYNDDRNSAIVTTADIYRDPTVTFDGTRLVVDHLGTNNPKTRLGGASREYVEWILKQNEQYLVKFTAEEDKTKMALLIDYYEISP